MIKNGGHHHAQASQCEHKSTIPYNATEQNIGCNPERKSCPVKYMNKLIIRWTICVEGNLNFVTWEHKLPRNKLVYNKNNT